jgi:hypothetical protein
MEGRGAPHARARTNASNTAAAPMTKLESAVQPGMKKYRALPTSTSGRRVASAPREHRAGVLPE